MLIDAGGEPIAERWVVLGTAAVGSAVKASQPPNMGVLLEATDDPAVIVSLDSLKLVAVRFMQATDGRGYSIARLLRRRYGWQGPLRATGDVGIDQIGYLRRCGFDQFELRDGVDVDAARIALRGFSERYQASSDGGPLFDRRTASV